MADEYSNRSPNEFLALDRPVSIMGSDRRCALLPILAEPTDRPRVPISADLQPLLHRLGGTLRRDSRKLAGSHANLSLPSVASRRI